MQYRSLYVPTLKELCLVKIATRTSTNEHLRQSIVASSTDQLNMEALSPFIISALYLQNPKHNGIPVDLLESIMNTCEGLIYDIFAFYVEILSELDHAPSKSKLYEILHCIRLDHNGRIDESGSLISAIKCGVLMCRNLIPFLAKYWVDPKELKETLLTYGSKYELLQAGFSSEQDMLELDWATWYAICGIKSYNVSKFWIDELPLSMLRHAFLIKAGRRTLEYFYNAIEESQRQTELERILKVSMYEQDMRWKEFAFIIEKLEPVRLEEMALSHEYARSLYRSLFLSWRYRGVGAELFLRLAPRMCPTHAMILLNSLIELLLYFQRRYFLGNYSDLKSIFIKIWKNSPGKFKDFLMDSGPWMRNFLSKLCELEDESLLMCVVDTDYCRKNKKIEVCLYILLIMIQLNKTSYINYCVLTIADNSPETYDGTYLLTYDSLADFIHRAVEFGDVMLLTFMPAYLTDIIILKWNIITDSQLLLKIFIKHFENTRDHKMTSFLQWLLNSNNSMCMYIQSVTSRRNWHQSVYTSLIANLNFDAAVNFFEVMRIRLIMRLDAQNSLRQNMVLLYVVVTSLLKKQIMRKVEWSQTNRFLDVLFDEHLDKVQFIQEFLLSDEGSELLMSVLTVSACHEQYLYIKYEAFKMYKTFTELKRVWIEPYLEPAVIAAKLRSYGHPNTKENLPTLLERCCMVPARYISDVRRIIDANYRFFLAVLSADLEENRVLQTIDARRTVTEVSQDVARLAFIDVEVVF